MGLEEAFRLGEPVVEAACINRHRLAVDARLDRQDHLSLLKPGKAEQPTVKPKLGCAMVGFLEAYDSNLDLTHRRLLVGQ